MELDMEVFALCRFDLTPLEAVAYFLPRLLSGETLHGAERFIHRADIYGNLEPKDLAAAFPPANKADRTGARFFFTLSKRQKGSRSRSARSAGAGTWTIQKTIDIYDEAGVKVGEEKKLSFKSKKDKESSGWVMEEYRCLLPEAVVNDGEMVLCKIHLSHSACSKKARQRSAARRLSGTGSQEQDQPAPMPEVTAKRPAPAASDHDPPCPKRARVAAAEADHGGEIDGFASSLEDLVAEQYEPAVEAAADNMMDPRFSCTMEELLGGAATDEDATLPAVEEAEQQQMVDFDFNFDDLPVLDDDTLGEIMLSLDDEAPTSLPALDDGDLLSLPAVEAEQLRGVDLPIASDEGFDFELPTDEELDAMISHLQENWPVSFAPDGDLVRIPGLPAVLESSSMYLAVLRTDDR